MIGFHDLKQWQFVVSDIRINLKREHIRWWKRENVTGVEKTCMGYSWLLRFQFHLQNAVLSANDLVVRVNVQEQSRVGGEIWYASE